MNYVLGFAFGVSHLAEPYVALIKKTKPDWQAGKLNGIGGKVGRDELNKAAMVRKFREETGADTDPEKWDSIGDLQCPETGARVFLFAINLDWEAFEELRTTTEEEVVKIRVDRVFGYPALPNLAWLIPMARAYLVDPGLPYLEIIER